MAKKRGKEKEEPKPRYCTECGCKLRTSNKDPICSPCKRSATIKKHFGSELVKLFFDDEPHRSNI